MADVKQIDRDINRMRRVLETFGKMGAVDRWYVLTRIAQKDDPAVFKQVCRENRNG